RLAPGITRKVECRVAEAATQVISVVKRTPEGDRLAFKVSVPVDLTAAIDEADLAELLGNLIENAARFAASSVTVDASRNHEGIVIRIIDDGPGVAEADQALAIPRGVRLDTDGSGSGLGLAIVSDIVEAYGG